MRIRGAFLFLLVPIAMSGCAGASTRAERDVDRMESDVPKSRSDAEKDATTQDQEQVECPECTGGD